MRYGVGCFAVNWNARYRREDCATMSVAPGTSARLPWSGGQLPGLVPPSMNCFATPTPPLPAVHPATALLPTMPPSGENPTEMYPPLSGADRTKLHVPLALFPYCSHQAHIVSNETTVQRWYRAEWVHVAIDDVRGG